MSTFDLSRSIFKTSTAVVSQDTLQTVGAENTALLSEPVLMARDSEWEAELLTHLSEHEQRFREFTRTGFRKNPHDTALRALGMVQAIDAYAATLAVNVLLIQSNLGEVRTRSTIFENMVQALPKPLPPRKFLGFEIGSAKVEPVMYKLSCELIRQLPGIMERYLILLGNGFVTGPMAAKWIETCGIFIRQLNKLVSAITS